MRTSLKLFIVVSFLFGLVFTGFISAQTKLPLANKWTGKLEIGGMELRIVFNVEEQENGEFTATLDSPDQGAFDIPVASVTVDGNKVKFDVSSINGVYEGILNRDSLIIDGKWTQGGQSFPLKLTKTNETFKQNRPQEPEKPYPYKSENVYFYNDKAKITLAGTLTLPESDTIKAAAILISGSGPQDRNETIMGHKPFLVLSDYLTRNGIAVLRFDDRGVAESEGDFQVATTFDFVDDVEAAVKYIKTRSELKNAKFGLIGHSEGGLIAPIVANDLDDIFFVVLMAAPGVRGDSLLYLQQRAIGKASGFNDERLNENEKVNRELFKLILNNYSDEEIKPEMRTILTKYVKWMQQRGYIGSESNEDYINRQISILLSPWFKTFVKYDPQNELEKLKCYVLAINGEKDLQVTPKVNLGAIKQALQKGGNSKYLIKEFKGLNHLFQTAKTGLPGEYSQIEETFSPKVLKFITDWINKIVN